MDEDRKRPAAPLQEPKQPPAQWNFSPSDEQPLPPQIQPEDLTPASPPEVRWTASEFIAHHKTAGWYGLLFVAAFVAAGLVYLLTRGDKISSVVVIVAAIFFAITASRKPRVLDYEVSNSGITIGQRFYAYGSFRSFSIVEDGAFSSISFMPLKRFMPAITIYYAQDDEDRIVEVLGRYLPIEPARQDALDRFVKHIRF